MGAHDRNRPHTEGDQSAHRPSRGRRTRPWIAAAAMTVAALAVITVTFVHSRDGGTTPAALEQAGRTASSAANAPAAPAVSTSPTVSSSPTTTPTPATTTPAPAAPTVPSASTVAQVTATATSLTAALPAGGVSIAELNLTTGASYQYGALSGMNTGSIIKLDILETLLLQDQDAGTTMSSSQIATATTMIENSNNDSAEDLFEDIGGRTALLAANPRLGVSARTVPGPGDYWGLTTTDGPDQIALLKNLVTTGPLTTTSQQFILGLMRNVESDQRWGVGVAADAGTDFANKNGWLAVDDDNDLWLVNSLGVITVKGQSVLIAVLTQHNQSFDGGIALVQSLATAVIPAVVL